MPWFRVDDKLHDHRKARRARKSAMGVWVLAGSWCMDNLSNGFVPEDVLPRWGTKADAKALVDVGLWHPDEKDGEPGWSFHDWHEFQPTRAEIEALRQKRAEAGRQGGKNSGASRRKAKGEASASGGASRGLEAKSNPQSQPHSLSVVATSSQSSSATRGLDDDGLTRIRQALNNCPEKHARECAQFVLAKAPDNVRNPAAYVLAAIRDEPDAYRYRRGNPKRDQECPTHAGQWADACAGCAADRKASA